GWLRATYDQTSWRAIAELAVTGMVLLVLAYGLAFTHFPPTAVNGRGTSVHLGATLGAAILFASGAWALQRLVKARLAAVVVAAYFALAGGYAMTIERDFAASW